jgi:transposase
MSSTETTQPVLFNVPCSHDVQPKMGGPAQPRVKKINRDQMVLNPTNVEDLVSADHEVRAIWEITGQVDLTAYYSTIEAVEGKAGREAHDPRVLTALWLYAYKEGIGSAREIAQLCEHEPAFQWLTGLQFINHHTLSDFRVNNKEGLDELFTSILGMLSCEGLVDLMRVMHDGTKVKAKAKGSSFRREDRIKEHLAMARRQVAEMGDPREASEVSPRVRAARARAAREKQAKLALASQEIKKIQESKKTKAEETEARASETDPESRIMKGGQGHYGPSYNLQISTDSKAGVIVGVGVSQSSNDENELMPAVDRIKETMGKDPEQMVVDGGFTNRSNVMEMEARGIDLVGPLVQRSMPANVMKMDPMFRTDGFEYKADEDQYRCPAGNALRLAVKKKIPGGMAYEYRAEGSDCRSCPFKERCCPKSMKHGRALTKVIEDPVVIKFRDKMATEEMKAIYKKRSQIAEFPNAWIKDKIGLRQFHVQGKTKVEMESLWACLTYNIQLWIRLIWRPKRAALAFG